MSEWQPIETAPKDGTKFLAYTIWRGPGDLYPYYEYEVAHWSRSYFSAPKGIPTHWQPLPTPPDSKIPQQNQPK